MFINEVNSSVSGVLNDDYRPIPDQIRRMLGFLEGGTGFADRIFYVPDEPAGPTPKGSASGTGMASTCMRVEPPTG